MKCVVLAAGKGTRMLPLTEEIPKAMVLLGKKPLLQWHLESLVKAGAEKFCIISGWKREKIEEYFGKEFHGIPIEYVFQEKQLGNAHAIGLAEKFVSGEKFLVSYCDVIMDSEFIKKFMEFGKKSKESDAVVAVRKVSDVSKFGWIKTKGEKVLEIIEKPEKKQKGLINAGLWFFSPKIFEEIRKTEKSKRGELEITDSVKPLIKKGKLGFLETKQKVFDIGTIGELKKAEKEIN